MKNKFSSYQTNRDDKHAKLAIKETTPTPINKASYKFKAVKEDAGMTIEQDTDLLFKAI